MIEHRLSTDAGPWLLISIHPDLLSTNLVISIQEEMSNHGYIASCLGPVVDIQLVADVYREDRFIHSRLREGVLRTGTTIWK